MKNFLFVTRFIIITLFIALFARPFTESQTSEQGNPRVTLLIDESKSMEIFNLDFIDNLKKEIDSRIPLRVRNMGSDPLYSDIGNQIISNIEHDGTLLIISDFQNTHGMNLEDAFAHSSLLNASISAINIKTDIKDAGVVVEGPSKATANDELEFKIIINKINLASTNVLISVNNEPLTNIRTNDDIIPFTHAFGVGEHVITAKILDNDDISKNNVFYKTVSVVPRPKILYVTQTRSRLPELLMEHYNVDRETKIPDDLSPYYMIIIEDMNTRQINNVDKLMEFVSEGNGLFVIGGMNSYDRGGYRNSNFETLLPVQVGRGEKKQGDSSIVILIDMSGYTGSYWTRDATGSLVEIRDTNPADTIKALAIDVIETLNRGNKVGVIAFAIPDPDNPATLKAVPITNLNLLSIIKDEAVDKISRVAARGQGLFDVGISGAYQMLRHESGSRNIILISDGGGTVYKNLKDNARNIVSNIARDGIRTYTVGVGRDVDEEYLRSLAAAGNGLYFPASQANRLNILFGTPEEKKQGDQMSLFVLDPMHFITKNLELNARIYGFNEVIPKNLGRTIVTTDSGEPALTEWRYGLGKVVSLTVFSGTSGLGQLLSGNNSLLITRTINYLIEDPQRKEDFIINIADGFSNEILNINVISKDYPKSDFDLIKVKDDEYIARTRITEEGISEILGTKVAINYPREYQKLGLNKDIENLLKLTNGKLFEPEDVNNIINHIRDNSRRTRITKNFIVWQILLAIIIVYLIEIIFRKILENKKSI